MKQTRYNSSMKWPHNFIYAVTNEYSEIPDEIAEEVIENILNLQDNRIRDILWRRFHNYEMCKDVARLYEVTDSRIATIIRESCIRIDSVYHDSLLSGIMPKDIELTEDSDIHVVMSFGLDKHTCYSIIRYFCRMDESYVKNGVKIKDVVDLYNEKRQYRSNSARYNELMEVRGIGSVSYYNITRILKEHGFIDGEIDKFRQG